MNEENFVQKYSYTTQISWFFCVGSFYCDSPCRHYTCRILHVAPVWTRRFYMYPVSDTWRLYPESTRNL